MRRIVPVVLICLLIISIFGGCSLLQKLGIRNINDETQPVSSIYISEAEARKFMDKVPVTLYFATKDDKQLVKVIRYVPMAEIDQDTGKLASLLVKELIKGPGKDTKLKPTIPEGTALRSPVVVKDGVAIVDFTKEFVDKHPGGKDAEQMTIFSIVNTLTELKDIEKVKFTVEGQTRSEFKGNFRFDAEFPRTPSLIGKDGPVKESIEDTQENDREAEENESEDAGLPASGTETDISEPYIEILE